MLANFRRLAGSLFFTLLALSCRSSDKSSSSSTAGAYSCSITQNSALVLCTEYSNLSTDALAKIQSNCQLKGNGYTWAAAACASANRQTGSCVFAASDTIPASGSQYFYGSGFSDESTRQGMCSQQGGTYQ